MQIIKSLKSGLDKVYIKFGVKKDPNRKPVLLDVKETQVATVNTPPVAKSDVPAPQTKKTKFFIFEKKDPKEKERKEKEKERKLHEDTTLNSVLKKPKGSSKDDSTQRYLPFGEIRDNIMVMKDGSVRMILRVDTVNFNLKSEEEQDAIIYSYQHFLNSLQFPIQILVRSLKVDIEGYIERLNIIANGQSNQLLKEQTVRYVEFLTNLVDMAQIMKKEFYIIVPHDEVQDASVRSRSLFQMVTNFWDGFNQGQSIIDIRANLSRLERMRRRIQEKTNQIRSALEYVGLPSQVLKKEELVELLMGYYNPKMNSLARIRNTMSHVDIEGM